MISGIDYFPHECRNDESLEYLESECGIIGWALIFKLHERIYGGRGYYCEYNHRVMVMFAHANNVDTKLVSQVVDCALEEGIFDKNMYKKYGILTSEIIQRNFLNITKRRKEIFPNPEYVMPKLAKEYSNVCNREKNVNISDENVSISGKNVSNSEQSKVKDSKVKDSKVKDSKAKDSKAKDSKAKDSKVNGSIAESSEVKESTCDCKKKTDDTGTDGTNKSAFSTDEALSETNENATVNIGGDILTNRESFSHTESRTVYNDYPKPDPASDPYLYTENCHSDCKVQANRHTDTENDVRAYKTVHNSEKNSVNSNNAASGGQSAGLYDYSDEVVYHANCDPYQIKSGLCRLYGESNVARYENRFTAWSRAKGYTGEMYATIAKWMEADKVTKPVEKPSSVRIEQVDRYILDQYT